MSFSLFSCVCVCVRVIRVRCVGILLLALLSLNIFNWICGCVYRWKWVKMEELFSTIFHTWKKNWVTRFVRRFKLLSFWCARKMRNVCHFGFVCLIWILHENFLYVFFFFLPFFLSFIDSIWNEKFNILDYIICRQIPCNGINRDYMPYFLVDQYCEQKKEKKRWETN